MNARSALFRNQPQCILFKNLKRHAQEQSYRGRGTCMRTITAALIGAGQRGMGAYAPYALENPDDLQFVAVADMDPERRERFRQDYRIPDENCFSSWLS